MGRVSSPHSKPLARMSATRSARPPRRPNRGPRVPYLSRPVAPTSTPSSSVFGWSKLAGPTRAPPASSTYTSAPFSCARRTMVRIVSHGRSSYVTASRVRSTRATFDSRSSARLNSSSPAVSVKRAPTCEAARSTDGWLWLAETPMIASPGFTRVRCVASVAPVSRLKTAMSCVGAVPPRCSSVSSFSRSQ